MCQKYIPSVASPIKVHTRSCLCPAIYLIVLGDAGQRPASSVRTTLVQRRGIPYPQACHALLTRFAWILSEPACLSSEWYSAHMPISNPAQGRSARFVSAWSGGEVELITLINSGMEATQLLRRPRRRLAQKPMATSAIRYIHKSGEDPETPIKNSTAGRCGRTRHRIA